MVAPTQRLTIADLVPAVTAVVADETDLIANMANISALIFEAMPDLNWAGFYLWKDGQLVLGPFQGRMACTRIPLGKGVCGTVAQERRTRVVPDVHDFPGHIACDAASASEIVVPVLAGGALLGVLDVDSPLKDRFTQADRIMLEAIVQALVQALAR
ncbi:GAF domain-containing protein [Acetobacter sp. TBRC 12305]|uniref:GAF domain-containing protein n=1 Tax=Acetobacter garciniae TaxID=2817435 RepID=A0A939KQL5_9PROT|nr:GAF domain-containing protein [Acetobacter garciniae]MBO1325497.1 GAF domain-containing protein [Acetobacter garciniae]MBX0345331.1 GAF domain-containing protein [Acetobacter garciniae]